jgi:hypothetical protein
MGIITTTAIPAIMSSIPFGKVPCPIKYKPTTKKINNKTAKNPYSLGLNLTLFDLEFII